jgi:hypothetical protein
MQAVGDTDFEAEVKFLSAVTQAHQMQGLIVEQDAENFLRFDVYAGGGGVQVFAASFVNGSPTILVNAAISAAAHYYLRVKREGSQWTYSYSADGTSWTVGASFPRSMSVNQVGVFGGNGVGSASPGFTAVVDYLFNTASPIVPEDGGQGAITVSVQGNGTVGRNPEQASYEVGQVVELTAVPAAGWSFLGWSGAVSGSENPLQLTMEGDCAVTAYFTHHATEPAISVWYGDHQVFGHQGMPQHWVNILGNVGDPQNVTSLTYWLNGSFGGNLSLGPWSPRLVQPGDYNIEIDYAELLPGLNQVVIFTQRSDGTQNTRAVMVDNAAGNVWPTTYSIDWTTVTSIVDVVQVVDGKWTINADQLRILETGYDRLIALGDLTWADYEITVPITVHSTDGPSNNPSAVGFLLRWDGHDLLANEQPRLAWYPNGAVGWYRWHQDANGPTLEIIENGPVSGSVLGGRSLELGVKYMFKMRVETLPPGSSHKCAYSLKFWQESQPEPAGWDLVHWASTGFDYGSLLLIAHYADAAFGNVTVVPVAQP